MKAFKSGNHLEWTTLVFAPLLLFVALVTAVCLLPPTSPGSAAASPYLQNASFDSRVRWYIESGQWRADAATLVALVKYLGQPDPTPASTQPALVAEPKVESWFCDECASRTLMPLNDSGFLKPQTSVLRFELL
jgi:hypothetical protein